MLHTSIAFWSFYPNISEKLNKFDTNIATYLGIPHKHVDYIVRNIRAEFDSFFSIQAEKIGVTLQFRVFRFYLEAKHLLIPRISRRAFVRISPPI